MSIVCGNEVTMGIWITILQHAVVAVNSHGQFTFLTAAEDCIYQLGRFQVALGRFQAGGCNPCYFVF